MYGTTSDERKTEHCARLFHEFGAHYSVAHLDARPYRRIHIRTIKRSKNRHIVLEERPVSRHMVALLPIQGADARRSRALVRGRRRKDRPIRRALNVCVYGVSIYRLLCANNKPFANV